MYTWHLSKHNGFSYLMKYDSANRISKIGIASATGNDILIPLAEYGYNSSNGMLDTMTYGNGTVKSFSYNKLGQITEEEYNGVLKYAWDYSRTGLVTKHMDCESDITWNYGYDEKGRLTDIIGNNGNIARFHYTKTGDFKTYFTYSGIGVKSAMLEYTYENTDSHMPKAKTSFNDSTLTKVFDPTSRLISKELRNNLTSNYYKTTFGYEKASGIYESGRVNKITYERKNSSGSNLSSSNISYKYDKNGNITQIIENGTIMYQYHYDEQIQLVREDNRVLNKSVMYLYDAGGNLYNKRYFAFTTGSLYGSPTTIFYQFDSEWKDKLAKITDNISGKTYNITYDSIGNPINYRDELVFGWTQGRRLSTVKKNGSLLASYKYNADGLRTKKTVNGVTTDYFWVNDKLMSESNSSRKILYWYDESGSIEGFEYNGSKYYYKKNLQGDIIGILDRYFNEVAKYYYDAWGKLLYIRDGNDNDVTNNTSHIGYINPIRY